MRGRERGSVLIWLLLCALVGGVFAVGLAQPVYRSEGLIRIPEPIGPIDEQAPCPWRPSAATLLSQSMLAPSLAERAVRQRVWRDARGYRGPGAIAKFQARCRLEPDPARHCVRVFFEDPQPRVARAGVRSLLAAYQQCVAESPSPRVESQPLGVALRDRVARLRAEMVERDRRLSCLLYDYGDPVGVEAAHEMAVHDLRVTKQDLARVEEMVDLGEAPAGTTPSEFEALRGVLSERAVEQHGVLQAIRTTRSEVAQLVLQQEEAEGELAKLAAFLEPVGRDQAPRPGLVVVERGTLPSQPIRRPRGTHAALGALAGASLGLLLLGLLSGSRR